MLLSSKLIYLFRLANLDSIAALYTGMHYPSTIQFRSCIDILQCTLSILPAISRGTPRYTLPIPKSSIPELLQS